MQIFITRKVNFIILRFQAGFSRLADKSYMKQQAAFMDKVDPKAVAGSNFNQWMLFPSRRRAQHLEQCQARHIF